MSKNLTKCSVKIKKTIIKYFNHNKFWKVGFLGMIFINIASLPQVIKTGITHETGGISLSFYIVLFTGLTCYLFYSLKKKDVIYILSNTVSLCTSGLMIFMILLFGGLTF